MPSKKLAFVNGKRTLVDVNDHPRQDSDRAYNQHRKQADSPYLKFYRSVAWVQLRKQILIRDSFICQRCGLEASLVDHIVSSEDDWEDRFNPDNLQSLCTDCHYWKTRRETAKRAHSEGRAMRINIIAGYPASGKTTYVHDHLGKHDLVYDYDVLMSALTGLPMHADNIDANDYVRLFYELLIRKLRAEQNFENVWIIMTYPDEKLDSLLASRDLHHLMLSTSKEKCIQRLNQQHRNVPELLKVMKRVDELKITRKFDDFEIVTA